MKASRSRKLILLFLCALCIWHGTVCAEETEASPDAAAADSVSTDISSADDSEDTQANDAEGAEETENAEEGPEGGMPSGFPGGGRPAGGGRPGGGKDGSSSGITPGKALTSSHARGNSEMLRHGAVALTADTETMDTLTLGGKSLALSCGGHAFTVSLEEDVLILQTDDADDWSLTMDVLKTLNLSGIRQLHLIGPGGETVLDTSMELTGSAYARARASGFVSSDFLLLRRGENWIVQVNEKEYRLLGNEMI